MRYLTSSVQQDLQKKMVLLSGPRQAGKTTFAQSLMGANGIYLNWDIQKHRQMIREVSWKKDSSMVVLDELHRMPKWKNYLKGLIDEFHNRPPLLVTGSARLEIFRKAGDPLTGRYFSYRLHPIDLGESKLFLPELPKEQRLERLLQTGGFPEAFLNPVESERLRNDRFSQVLREDLRDLSNVSSFHQIELLVELLRERVGGICSYANLAQDLSASAPSVKRWVSHLENLYLLFLVYPFSRGLARSIRKEPKIYFYDAAASMDETSGSRLENVVACALLKFANYQYDRFGKKFSLHYYRDRDKREVDFVLALNRKPHWCIEVKSEGGELHSALRYLHERLKPQQSIQLVLGLKQEKEIDGIQILNLENWLEKLT